MKQVLLLIFFRFSNAFRVLHSQQSQDQIIGSWDETLQSYLDKVEGDTEAAQLAARLHKYGEERLSEHRNDILVNLNALGVNKFDLLWPGAGYASVAAGGQYEVLSLLRKAGAIGIGRIMGASGGAASAILSLADANGGTDTLLTYYLAYAAWLKETNPLISVVDQGVAATPLWSAIYRRILKAEGAFARVKEQAWVVSSCGIGSWNSVMHNFGSESQCAQAYYTSGNASLQGSTIGTSIPGNKMFSRLGGTCGDGGKVRFFPQSTTPLLYYRTKYAFTDFMSCTRESIERLFKNGVDETISLLRSPSLAVKPDGQNRGGMRVVQPGPGGMIGSQEFKSGLKHFLDERAPWSPTSGCTYVFDVAGNSSHYSQNC